MEYSNYYGLRRTPYADIIRAEAPAAKAAAFAKRARDLSRKNQGLQYGLANKGLEQQQEQFEQSMDESQRQFAESYALQKANAEEQAKQSQLATGLSTIGLGIEAYPYAKDVGVGLSDLLFADSAATTGTTAATGTTTGIGAGTAAGESASGASSGLGAVGNAATILAIIAGQHHLSDLTETEFEGQRTGDFFTFDEQGRWAPRFGNEPWHGFMNQQWGLGPSAGEKFDAAMYNGDWNLAARRAPAAAQQWLNPVGDFGYDAIEGRWGSEYAGGLDPVTYGFDRLSGAKDIGEAGQAFIDTSAKVIDPVGSLAGTAVKDVIGNWTDNETIQDVAYAFLNPVGAVGDVISNWSFLCTETEKIIGLEPGDRIHLNKLNHFSKDWPLSRHYYRNAPRLIKEIAEAVDDVKTFYTDFYNETIVPVIQLVRQDKMIEARNRYAIEYLNLLEQYAPELFPERLTPEVHNG